MQKYKLSKRNLSYIIALAILLAGLINQLSKPREPQISQQNKLMTVTPATSSTQLIKVTRVIDGDTIELETGQKVRYIGIDTPELHDSRKPVQCFAYEAMVKNKELVEGKMLRLEKDVSEADKYGRLLRYVYVSTEASPSGLLVNEYLVREGYANLATFPPDVKYSDHFRLLEQEARENKRGLWSKCR